MDSEKILLPRYVLSLMERLEGAGEEVYLVGGSLRDILLGNEPHDYDLATSAMPEQTVALFEPDYRVIKTGLKHGTVTVLSQGNPIEITTFRIDGSYTDSRHPDCVRFTRRITEDLSRRDFTVNAMAYHPRVGVVDPFGGKEDLERGLLRAVGDPCTRFREDALRIMRAFRFSAQLGFSLHEETLAGAISCRDGLGQIARERIASELLRLLISEDPAPALLAMIKGEILPYVTGDYCPDPALLSRLKTLPKEEIPRLGLFFADGDRERAASVLRSLKYSNKQIVGTCAVVANCRRSVSTPAEARQLIAISGIYAVWAAHVSAALGISPPEAVSLVEQNTAACTLADLAIGGRDLMAIGMNGKDIGRTLEHLLAAVLEDPSLNRRESLLTLARAYACAHTLNTETNGTST